MHLHARLAAARALSRVHYACTRCRATMQRAQARPPFSHSRPCFSFLFSSFLFYLFLSCFSFSLSLFFTPSLLNSTFISRFCHAQRVHVGTCMYVLNVRSPFRAVFTGNGKAQGSGKVLLASKRRISTPFTRPRGKIREHSTRLFIFCRILNHVRVFYT